MGFFDKSNEEVVDRVLSDFGNLNGVKDVVDGYLALVESEVYKKTVFIGFDGGADVDVEDLVLVKCAVKYLSTFPLRLPFIPLFDVKDFYVTYTFIWNIWRCQLGRELSLEENTTVFHSNLTTRIIFLLEDFDSNLETPPVDEEFFRKLGKIKKKDKRAKKLIDGFLDIRQVIKVNTYCESPVTFGVNEIAWLDFLAGCSAVKEGRNYLSVSDIVTANKVYIKLVNTDLDSLIRSL
ncbi:MAG: hypothetical protein Q8N97_05495 [Methanobacteriaceae archaeon]|nr:hypothetical protein [Methanobacteriaceae archaeon]